MVNPQNKPTRSIRAALSAATCSLLALSTPSIKAEEVGIQASSTSMLYAEYERVRVFENIISVTKELENEQTLTAKFVVDVMAGASPNGAATIREATQTITSPSGNQTNIAAGKQATNPFFDQRMGISFDWSKPWQHYWTTTSGIFYSTERDYSASGGSLSIGKDLFNRHTTLTAAIAGSYDHVKPQGGTPIELRIADTGNNKLAQSKHKIFVDSVLGVSQILNRRSLLQINYSYGLRQGYLNDPYKVISYLDSGTGLPRIGSKYYYEKRPDSRKMQSIYSRLLHHLKNHIVSLSYRYYFDDWKIRSHTVDLKLTTPLKNQHELQWHARMHSQQQAYFYRYALYNGNLNADINSRDIVVNPATLNAASADYRLGSLYSYTLGAKYKIRFKWAEIDTRLEYLQQRDKNNLFATLHAVILQMTVKAKF